MTHPSAPDFLLFALCLVLLGAVLFAAFRPHRPPQQYRSTLPPTGSKWWARRGDGWVCTHCGGRGSGWNQFGTFTRVCPNCGGRPYR